MDDTPYPDASPVARHGPNPAPLRVVGLRYDGPAELPTVIFKGTGPMAEQLLQARRQRPDAPPLVHNPTLLDALYRLPVDAAIGPELFQAVAAILVHVLAVDAREQGLQHSLAPT